MATLPPIPPAEDAFNWIIQFLKDGAPSVYGGSYGYDLYLPNAMQYYLTKAHQFETLNQARAVFSSISPPFYAAAWDLCRRGILRPGVKAHGLQSTGEGSAGDGYSLTPFGNIWLSEAGNSYDYVPTEPGRFAAMLDAFTSSFGLGFKERAQEAMRCYGAHAFLACCAMCGAAAESIFLAVAIKKDGNQAKVEKDYLATGGRGRVEKRIVGQLTSQLADEFKRYVALLKYWR